MNKTLRLAALLSAVIFLSGCATVALIGVGAGIGVGTYKYIEGGVEKDYPVAYDTAWDASHTAMANLYISVTESTNEGTKGKIVGIRKDEVKVIIKLEDKGQGVSTINVRVGFGNREESERIHEEIMAVAQGEK